MGHPMGLLYCPMGRSTVLLDNTLTLNAKFMLICTPGMYANGYKIIFSYCCLVKGQTLLRMYVAYLHSLPSLRKSYTHSIAI